MKLREILNENEDMRSKLTNVELEDVHHDDYPRYSDAYVSAAVWKATGKALTDAELEMLRDKYPEVAGEEATEDYHGAAEAASDAARGH